MPFTAVSLMRTCLTALPPFKWWFVVLQCCEVKPLLSSLFLFCLSQNLRFSHVFDRVNLYAPRGCAPRATSLRLALYRWRSALIWCGRTYICVRARLCVCARDYRFLCCLLQLANWAAVSILSPHCRDRVRVIEFIISLEEVLRLEITLV